MSKRTENSRAVRAARNIEILQTSLLVVGLIASLAAAGVGIKVWATAKSPEEIGKEKEYRKSMNELKLLAARAEGPVATRNELSREEDFAESRWSGPLIVAAAAAGFVSTLVIVSLLSASAHRLRLLSEHRNEREG